MSGARGQDKWSVLAILALTVAVFALAAYGVNSRGLLLLFLNRCWGLQCLGDNVLYLCL